MESKIANKQEVAEVELRYKTNVHPDNRAQIKSSQDAYRILFDSWNKNTIEHIEEFKLLLMNRANRVLGMVSLSKGSTSGSIVDIKVILQYAIKANASSIIVSHNHPSGNPEPSESDRKITNRIKQSCDLIEISCLDHLIVLPVEGYFSFSDE